VRTDFLRSLIRAREQTGASGSTQPEGASSAELTFQLRSGDHPGSKIVPNTQPKAERLWLIGRFLGFDSSLRSLLSARIPASQPISKGPQKTTEHQLFQVFPSDNYDTFRRNLDFATHSTRSRGFQSKFGDCEANGIQVTFSRDILSH
jgi:hypothetical protein